MLKSFAAATILLVATAQPALAEDATAPAAQAPAPIDPARLAVARAVVDHIFPTGTYGRMMDGSFQAIMKAAVDGAGNMPLRQIAVIAGTKEDEIAKLGDGTLNQIMEIYDPAYKPRMNAMMDAMSGEMGKLMTTFEPAMREGLTQAYAHHYTADQMADFNRFFDTPSGQAYARDSMILFMDPAVMEQMQKAMPELMKQMPAMLKTMETAATPFPKPRQYKDLSKDERARLARLLGVTEAQLAKQNRQ